MKCSNCGQELEKDAVFCTSCGNTIVRKTSNEKIKKVVFSTFVSIIGASSFILGNGFFIEKENVQSMIDNSEEIGNEQIIESGYKEDISFFSPLSCIVSYAEKMTHGYTDEMLQMIPKEEIELCREYDLDVLNYYKNYYSVLTKNNGIYGNDMSVEVSYDSCLEYDVHEFMEFIGVDEENVKEQLGIASDYFTGFQTYYIYIGVNYASIDMNTGEISEYISWQPADYLIVGERKGKYFLIGELLLKFV